MKLLTAIPFRTFVLTGVTIGIIVLVLLFVGYQARYLILGPQVTISEFPTGPQNERQISISGSARNISRLWLNDRPIYTDPNGTFMEEIILENGYTIITLRAEDRYGRSTVIERPLVYAPVSFVE